ncbi:MAG TPA: MBL fold metallo-hydrolase [Mycobacteriales bacterium]|nr:MBL fold metallo-hydrolase [Mycobacteriales bacterium]
MIRVTFCGVRGSTPSPGADFLRYGGNTSCLALSDGDGPPRLLLDAGTGLMAVTPLLAGRPFDGTVLLSHLHWDHTHGLPFFAGGGMPGARLHLRLPEQGVPAEDLLARAFSPPHFPVLPHQLGAGWSFDTIDEGEHSFEGFTVRALEIPHKGGRMFGYRVSRGEASLAYLTDHSPISLGPGPDGLGERHAAALELAHDVDVLIHDAQHRASQFPEVAYLGHASPEYAVALAREAGARSLMLFHHAPTRTDDEIDEILAELATDGLPVRAACEGLVLDLPEA